MAQSAEARVRKPSKVYMSKNTGFQVEVAAISEASTSPIDSANAMAVDSLPNDQAEKARKRVQEIQMQRAIDKHREADEVLEARGFYFPGLDAIQAELAKEETSTEVQEVTEHMRRRHHDGMNTLYDRVAEDYLGEAVDAYYSLDDTFTLPEIDAFVDRTRLDTAAILDPMLASISEVRYAHLYTQRDLFVRRKALVEQEEIQRKKRDAQFPADVSAYHAITHKDIRVRIARYLVADNQVRDKMRGEFNWVWLQCQPLEIQYVQNEPFRAEIRELIRETEASDPRRKSSTM